jgi:hypothetical protein
MGAPGSDATGYPSQRVLSRLHDGSGTQAVGPCKRPNSIPLPLGTADAARQGWVPRARVGFRHGVVAGVLTTTAAADPTEYSKIGYL